MSRYGVTERDELAMLQAHIPALFAAPGSLLYVGANRVRPPHHARTLKGAGWGMALLEVHQGNLEHYMGRDLFRTLIHGDVTTVDAEDLGLYDACMWWHGPEHVPRDDLAGTLETLEAATRELVVLGCPHGESPQGAEYGNEAERHQWSVRPGDLEAHGYNVVPYECPGRRHLLAWKWRSQ